MAKTSGLTVDLYAEAKLFDADKLRAWGVEDDKYAGRPAVRLTYWSSSVSKPEKEEGRWRLSLNGQSNFAWAKGVSARRLYGWERVDRSKPTVLLVEGESDCHALWSAGFRNVLGVPGVECVPDSISSQLEWAETVYAIDEQDDGSPRLLSTLAPRLGDKLRIVTVRPDAKDFSELWVELGGDRQRFNVAAQGILEAWREPTSEERDGKKRTRTPPRYRTDDDTEDSMSAPPVLPDHLRFYEPGDIGGHIPDPGDQILTGPIGEWISKVEPETEASTASLGVGIIAAFGAWLGRWNRLEIGRMSFPPNILAVQVGPTGLARKGTADGEIRRFLRHVDPAFAEANTKSGFGSGEALIELIADPVLNKKDEMVAGTEDQRLYIQEAEFSKVLHIADRQGSILSVVIRLVFDGVPISNLTKLNKYTSTNHCVSLFGGITPDELTATFPTLAATSGTGNRYLYAWSSSTKLLPEGGRDVDLRGIAQHIRAAKVPSKTFELTPAAREWWHHHYGFYREARHADDSVHSMVSRATDQILRVALVYAATGGASAVDIPHLEAGEAWVLHSADTVAAVLGGLVRNPVAATVLASIRSHPRIPVKRRDVFDLFHGHETAETINAAIGELVAAGLAYEYEGESGGGRPPTLIVATTPRKTRRGADTPKHFVRSQREKRRKPGPKPFVRKEPENETKPQVDGRNKREQRPLKQLWDKSPIPAESKQSPDGFAEAEQNLTEAGLDFDAETDRIAP